MNPSKLLTLLAPRAMRDAIQVVGALKTWQMFGWPQYDIEVDDDSNPRICVMTPKQTEENGCFRNYRIIYCLPHDRVVETLRHFASKQGWSGDQRFAVTNLWIKPHILRVLEETLNPPEIVYSGDYGVFYIPGENVSAMKASGAPPSAVGLTVDHLRDEDATAMAENWIYKSYYNDTKSCYQYMLNHIRHYPSVCLRSNDALVGWSCHNHYGALGFLHIMLPYRRRGLAIYLQNELLRRSEKYEFVPFGQVELINTASMNLIKKHGLVRIGEASCTWIQTARRSPPIS